MWNNYGRTFAEYMFIKEFRKGKISKNIKIDGQEILEKIKKYDTKLILGLGDNFYPSGVKSIYDDKFLDQFELPYSHLPSHDSE